MRTSIITSNFYNKEQLRVYHFNIFLKEGWWELFFLGFLMGLFDSFFFVQPNLTHPLKGTICWRI